MNYTKLFNWPVVATGAVTLFSVCALTIAGIGGDRRPVPVPETPKEMTFNSLRGVDYAEVWLLVGTPETGLSAIYYNTSGLNDSADKMDTCPPELWAKVNPEELKAKSRGMRRSLSSPLDVAK